MLNSSLRIKFGDHHQNPSYDIRVVESGEGGLLSVDDPTSNSGHVTTSTRVGGRHPLGTADTAGFTMGVFADGIRLHGDRTRESMGFVAI